MSDTKRPICGQFRSEMQFKLPVIYPFRLSWFSHFGPNKRPESRENRTFLSLNCARRSKTRPNRHTVCH